MTKAWLALEEEIAKAREENIALRSPLIRSGENRRKKKTRASRC